MSSDAAWRVRFSARAFLFLRTVRSYVAVVRFPPDVQGSLGACLNGRCGEETRPLGVLCIAEMRGRRVRKKTPVDHSLGSANEAGVVELRCALYGGMCTREGIAFAEAAWAEWA